MEKMYYDENYSEYIKRLYDRYIKNSITKAVVNIKENYRELKNDQELQRKIKMAGYISGLIMVGTTTSYIAEKIIENPNVSMKIDDVKDKTHEAGEKLVEVLKEATDIPPAVDPPEYTEIVERNKERLQNQNNYTNFVSYDSANNNISVNEDIIGPTKEIVTSGEYANKDLYQCYLNYNERDFNNLIEGIVFADPNMEGKNIKNFSDYLKVKGFNSLEEWLDYSKNEAESKGVSMGR